MSVTMRSKISFMPAPVLALVNTALLASSPTTSEISCFALSGLAEGKSILFMTGKISRF